MLLLLLLVLLLLLLLPLSDLPEQNPLLRNSYNVAGSVDLEHVTQRFGSVLAVVAQCQKSNVDAVRDVVYPCQTHGRAFPLRPWRCFLCFALVCVCTAMALLMSL